MYFIDGLINKNSPSEKLSSVIFGLLVSPLVINFPIDLQIDISLGKFAIYLSVNIAYYRRNTICNSVGELKVALTFTIMFFQLSGIYRRM
jgi:hypothetical protein